MIPTNEQVISFMNRDLMEDMAWRHCYGNKVETRLRSVINWTAVLMTIHEGFVPTMALLNTVERAMDTTRPTARKYIEIAYERGMISRRPKDDDDRVTLYFLNHSQIKKREEVENLIENISAVLTEQKNDPRNPRAGASLISKDVYMNIIAKIGVNQTNAA